MYSEKLEEVISAALADGNLTEQKRNIIMRRAEKEGEDVEEVMMVVEARLLGLTKEQPKQTTPQTEAVKDAAADGDFVETVNGVSFKMIKVEGGEFTMFSKKLVNTKQVKPQEVVLDDYYICETVVTQELWKAVLGSDFPYLYFIGDKLPVNNILWNECFQFIDKLNAMTNKKYHLPSEAQWEYAAMGGKKSLGFNFAGSDDSNFQFVSNVKLSDFDFIHFTIYNATDNLVRVWFSYANEIFVDIPSKTLATPSFAASTLSGQYYWAIHHLRSQYDSTRLPAYGSVYFGPVYVTGRSQETLSTQMQYIFSKLPNVSEVNSEDAYTRFVPMIKTARQLYNAVLDKSVLSEEEIQRFYDLEDLISNSGYSVGYNSYDGSLMRFSTYGENFTGYSGIQDPFFGYVSGADITNCPPHQDVPTLHEQAITFTDDMKLDINAGGYVIYIFNPTPHPFNLIVRTTDWDWEKYGHLFVYQTLENGWNKVEMKTDLLKASEDHKVAFFISDSGSDLDMTGIWKFTSLVAVPRSI